jgi:lysophospholipase L1-like esterase
LDFLVFSNSDLRIAGFGACMISGYPHKAGGLFEVACAEVEKQLGYPVRSTLASLSGFTAPRAEKHLPRKVLSFSPDYVVIQFGSSDAHCPVRGLHRKSSISRGLGSPTPDPAFADHTRSAGLISPAHWEVTSLIGYLVKADPETALPEYVAVMERMVTLCISEGAAPVVLSPFVFGSRYSTRSAVAFTYALRELAKLHSFILVDCVSALRALTKRSALQRDGIHLSQLGHRVVGEAIAASIVSDSSARSRAHAPSTKDVRR